MTEEKRKLLHPTSEVLVNVYKILQEKGEVSFAIHDQQIFNLDIIVKNVYAEYFGFVRFPTDKSKASAYFCFIIKNHPVTDGNKRLAVLWLDVFCHATNLVIKKDIKLDELAVGVEQAKELTIENLIKVVEFVLFETPEN